MHYKVTCWNNVSVGSIQFLQASQYPVYNLRLEKAGAMKDKPFEIAYLVDYGTDATYTLWFDGKCIKVALHHTNLKDNFLFLITLNVTYHFLTNCL